MEENMSEHGKRFSFLLAVSVLIALLAFIPKLVFASRQTDSPLPTPVAAEPYPNSETYPARVYLATIDDLQVLYALNIDIDGVQPVDSTRNSSESMFVPSIATVYINPAQSGALTQAGMSLVPIPNEGYRSFLAYGPGSGAPNAWPTFEQYVTRMQLLESTHPNIVDLIQIGTSVEGRGLYCMEISDNPGINANEPEFKYTANHHGDETTGIEMTMRFAELLANSYGTNPAITDMIDKMEIWLCPIYNPDGYVHGSRYNAHGVDLNRDFPDRFTDPVDNPANREPETQAFMNFGYAHHFVMGANFHGGAQVLNYPWDAVVFPDHPIIPAYPPDDALFFSFGYGYSSRNPDLLTGGFKNGLTRGWEWYQIWGGMQDWAYYYHSEHHVTIEISNNPLPPFNQMDTYWNHNRDAMLWWVQRAWTGLSGQVLDARNNAPLDATLRLVDRAIPNTILTDPEVGDYHRVISAGNYNLEASASGYITQTASVTVYSDTLTTRDFYLCPDAPWVVSGTITDSVTGLPLQAMIEFIGSRQTASSNPITGHYSLEICPASYTMDVWALWHYDEERLVTINQNQIQNFSLYPTPNLSPSTKQASATQVFPDDGVQYQLHVVNSGATANVTVTDTMPISLTWTGYLTATQGIPTFEAGQILWQGEVTPSQSVTITYAVSVNHCLPAGTSILNIAEFDDGVNGIITGKVQLEVSDAAPSTPASPFPLDGAIQQPITITLAWAPSIDLNCDPITYDLYFGTISSPPIMEHGFTTPGYSPGPLNPETSYYWQVVVHAGESQIIGPLWSFKTANELRRIFLPLTYK
jgi:hypothetical protein